MGRFYEGLVEELNAVGSYIGLGQAQVFARESSSLKHRPYRYYYQFYWEGTGIVVCTCVGFQAWDHCKHADELYRDLGLTKVRPV